MIINSLLDTDLYKFSMMQVTLHHFPGAQVEYKFKCRTPNVNLRPFIAQIREEISHLCTLHFTEDELAYLRSLRFIKSDFVDFLGLFHLPEKCITVTEGEADNEIAITVKGPWLHTIMFEIPVLAIVNEVYTRNTYPDQDFDEARHRLQQKIKLVHELDVPGGFKFVDYGTRRRFSRAWHEEVIKTLVEQGQPAFLGTSNVLLAKNYKTVPMGSMAHEYLQACQALGPRLRDSQTFALEKWAMEYRGDLGIALSDVYGFDAFLRDFDMYFCKLFDGCRHDSGDPFEWGEKLIEHYQKNRVDPRQKSFIFSDGLDFPLAAQIAKQFAGRCKVSFGIGTNLTNDVGPEALQIVMKMVRCNGQPVAKISDEPNKTMCDDEEYLQYLRYVFDVPDAKRPPLRP
ncbi:nicotinate phosphoribosyltransferase [Brackiella oedipodis]|uniref:nicotinate phosphoribosyltransferase n=1 Tax=Brackiella oedipodis TaxID=124225 RepID=UPI0004918428|nr:nicotinate phosphoribosyltransferase [Brackiella oedipodis]